MVIGNRIAVATANEWEDANDKVMHAMQWLEGLVWMVFFEGLVWKVLI